MQQSTAVRLNGAGFGELGST